MDDYLVAVVMAAEAQRPPRLVHKPEGREHAQHGRALAHLQKKKIKDEKISGSFATKLCLIFSSLLTIGGSFAKNLNLLAQKEKNIFYTRDPLSSK